MGIQLVTNRNNISLKAQNKGNIDLTTASGGAVNSVNGQIGDVVLDASSVGAQPKFITDETLKLDNGVLSVNTVNDVEQDNTLPITSSAVYTEVGNINILLATI